jgi:hypothetical protein
MTCNYTYSADLLKKELMFIFDESILKKSLFHHLLTILVVKQKVATI